MQLLPYRQMILIGSITPLSNKLEKQNRLFKVGTRTNTQQEWQKLRIFFFCMLLLVMLFSNINMCNGKKNEEMNFMGKSWAQLFKANDVVS